MEAPDLDVLIDGYADGSLGEAELVRLNAMLRDEPEARARFWLRQRLHAQLTIACRASTGSATARGPRGDSVRFERQPARRSVLAWWPLAAAALLALALGLWHWAAAGSGAVPSSALIAVVQAGACEVRRGERAEQLAPPAALVAGDLLTASAGGATLRYEDGTTFALSMTSRLRLLAPDERAGKRALLEDGSLTAEVAPQQPGHPLVISTPSSEATVVGTAFTLAARDGRTRLAVTSGRVRLTRLADRAVVEVGAGESAVASSGIALAAAPTVLFERDFETGALTPESAGTLVDGPARAGSHRCVSSVPIPEHGLSRVMIAEAGPGLFTYRDGAELSFDYWVEDRVGAISVYVWDRTQKLSPATDIFPPMLVKSRWSRATVTLADLHIGDSRLRDGDLITEITIQTAEGGTLFVDDVRVAMPPPQ